MGNDYNFPSACRNYLIDTRHIKQEVVDSLEVGNIISYYHDRVEFGMKDIDGSAVGTQERYLESINLGGKMVKSKTKSGTKVGYFYFDIDVSKPVIVVEGEIDWASVAYLPNTIGLQGIGNLRKLVEQLKNKGVADIYLLVDNDPPADMSIGKLLDMDPLLLGGIFDSRQILGNNKDINDYIVNGGEPTVESILDTGKSLKDFKDLMEKLVTSRRGVDHSQFAKYIIDKLNISSTNGNIFMYGRGGEFGIWKSLTKYQFENIIMNQLECTLGGLVPIFRNTDKNNIRDFVEVYAEDRILTERLLSKDDSEVNLKDCVLDPKTGNTKEYSKDKYKFQKFSYPYSIFSNSKEPLVRLEFLNQILEGYGDKGVIVDFLQEFVGSLLVTDTRYQKALLLYGSGANGKGIFLSLVRMLLGFNNTSSVGLHEINNSQNLYNLFGKLANIDSDMQQDVQLDSGVIKKIISGEPITAKIVYKQPLEYIPFARLLIATNEQPYLKTIDDSIRRRFIYLHLKNSFIGREDFDLLDKLSNEKELIFVWAVRGLSRLLTRGSFDIPQELKDNLDNFIKENDTVELFLDECEVERVPEAKIYNKDLYSLYKYFCNDCGYKYLSQRNFNKRMRDKGFQDFRDFQGRGFLGLGRIDPF